MKKILLLSVVSLFILSCGNQNSNNQSADDVDQTTTDQVESSLGNYAVIWSWEAARNADIVTYNSKISEEMRALWKDNVIENVYYGTESLEEVQEHYPNIAFFLKATSLENARDILSDLTIVKEGLAAYQLYPVGLSWLNRNTEAITNNGTTKAFVSVWSTENPEKITNEILNLQKDVILDMQQKGNIENVYFDIEGTQQENKALDFVFFVNSNTREEAEAVCNSLPFFAEGIATYHMHEAGQFWMGKYVAE